MLNNLGFIKRWLRTPTKRPPGPSWFQIRDEGLRPKHYWSLDYAIKLAQRYGDIIYIPAFKQHIITGPNAFEYILKTNHKNYQRNPAFYLRRMKPVFGNSLLVTEGDYWKHRRKIALPAYNQASIKHYIPIINQEVEALLKKWQIKLPSKINIATEMNLLTLKIALKLFCGYEFPDRVLNSLGHSIQFCNWYCANAIFLHRLKPTINQFRFNWHMGKIDKFVLNIIQKRRAQREGEPDDLLNLFICAKNEETNQPLTDMEVLAEFKTHLVTGHETTSCALSWMWYLLALHPEYQERLETELDSVLNKRLPILEDITNLPVTKAIILETFRLYPPIWSIARTNIEPDRLEGYDIPPQSQLILHVYALHRNPHYWERPNDFYPDRFLAKEDKRHPYLFLPFNAGPHTCIASHLAMTEATLLTAILAQKIHFKLSFHSRVIPEACISLRPKGGIRMRPSFR